MSEFFKLTAKEVNFYSEKDEKYFFKWMSKIKSIDRFEGYFDSVDIYVSKADLNECDLKEIIALFVRYGIDMQQFRKFDDTVFFDLLDDEGKYWYAHIFSSS